MPEYDNNMRGVLFENDRKERETQPDYTGHCEIEGIEYWMNAWRKVGTSSGKEFWSFSFKVKEPRPGDYTESSRREEKPAPKKEKGYGDDSDIPF